MTEKNHSCVAEHCEKCGQDHCRCSPCYPDRAADYGPVIAVPVQPGSLPQLRESWILKKVDGYFCPHCKLYCKRCGSFERCNHCGGAMITTTWYSRTQIEAITAILIWGVLTAGIAWAVLLAGKLFLNLKYCPPLIYDPHDPKLSDPKDESRTSRKFETKLFGAMCSIGVPFGLIVVIIAIVFLLFMFVLGSAVFRHIW